MSRVIFCPCISRSCGALGLVALTGLLATSCLGLDASQRQQEPLTTTTDTAPQACAGISCWEPLPNTCAANGELTVVAPSGYCSGGDCFYATGQEECHVGICDEGVCQSTPCQGVTCIDPPLAFCSEADRTIYAPSGYCTDGTCTYAWATSPCEEACVAGACVDSPCAEVFCLKPPAPHCEDDSNLVVFSPEGHCAVVGASAECRYDSQTLSCDHGCEGGRCRNDPCAGLYCDTPPARHCEEAVLVVYEPYGVCDTRGSCSYTEQRHPCVDPCVDARCGEDDACTWVICDKPPASYCKDDAALRVYGRDGWWCEEGFCFYTPSDIPCPEGCQDGRCTGTPCVGVSCDKPPAPHCNGDVLVAFEQTGICTNGACSYPETNTTCQDGCENAKCLTGGDTDTDADTDKDTSTGSGVDTDTGIEDTGWETSTDPQCSGRPDFTACELVTAPNRSYDICVGGLCVSPGCPDASCNTPGPHFYLPDTNQRTCYNDSVSMNCPSPGQDFYGQDAQYGWDTTHNESERYTRTTPVTGQPIVEDNVTLLIWQGCAGGLSGSNCAAGSESTLNWSEALAYCDNLGWGGSADWRLPDLYELSSIVDSGRANPAIDSAAFPATSNVFWSSSSYVSTSSLALNVDLYYGLVSSDDKNLDFRVRCVRGGPFESRRFESLTLSGDRVVRDQVNELEWQGCPAGLSGADCAAGVTTAYTWKNALAYCQGLSYGGYSDWRLPSRVELQSIVDQRRSSPSIDPAMFPATPADYFWSSSSYAGNSSSAWYVSFISSYVSFHDKGNNDWVRCVRSGP